MIKNILLAEDDRSTALLVKTRIEAKGYTVFPASNGIEALRILSSTPIDLIITDVVMPKMDGVDLFVAVKKNPATTSIPIIIVTDNPMFKESFAHLGVSNFIEKSSNINVLLEKIISIQENRNDNIKKFPKILICGKKNTVLEQIFASLNGKNYLVTISQDSNDILSKALTIKPNAIILDVLFQDDASAHELIHALRCFSSLGQTKIITFAYFPDDLGIDVDAVDVVKIAMAQCKQAGSDQYIGRFNQAFFLDKLAELGI